MTIATAADGRSFYDFKAKSLGGKDVGMSQYSGKVSLVVNTASLCGYTGQYKELQEIWAKYRDRGLVVLGFPSNDFGKQEPGADKDIKEFCDLKYRVSFPMFTKDAVSGKDKQPIYKFLTEEANPTLKGEVKWNFEKFLVNKKGQIVARYPSKIKPDDTEVIQKIEALIKE